MHAPIPALLVEAILSGDVDQGHVRSQRAGKVDGVLAVACSPDHVDASVAAKELLDALDEHRIVVGYEHANRLRAWGRGGFHLGGLPREGQSYACSVSDSAREKIQKHLVTGDNRLKQGVSPEKARESYEAALRLAQESGLEERIRPLVEVRLADLERPRG